VRKIIAAVAILATGAPAAQAADAGDRVLVADVARNLTQAQVLDPPPATQRIRIGFAVALRSVTHLFMTKGDYLVAQQAQVWMTGSLNGRGWGEAAPLSWALFALVPFVLWAARAQRTVAMDDDTATALGVRLGRVRFGLVLLGVVLASIATGAAGPVDFVALLAPQIARRMTRTAQIPLLCSALLGAVIVVLADLLARKLFEPTELPVGVLTAAVGAPYLIWLIIRSRTGGKA